MNIFCSCIITGAYTSGLAVDTCRHVYLLATPSGGSGGGVVVLDREGRKVRTLGRRLTGAVYGVDYNEEDDLYVMSDWDKNQVSCDSKLYQYICLEISLCNFMIYLVKVLPSS